MDGMSAESAQQPRALQNPNVAGAAGHAAPAADGLIEMRLRAIDQLFDPVDPSPFGQQDLSQWAAEYIVESVKEMQAPSPRELVIVIDDACDSGRASVIGEAVRGFFARQAMLRRRSLRRLLRRGLTTLAIGVMFLVAFFVLSRSIVWMFGDGPIPTLLREGSLIVGWVAMWRPIEIFLYDWWPIVGERRLYDRLSRLDVRIVTVLPTPASAESDPGPGGATGANAARSIERWETDGGRTRLRASHTFGEQPPAPPAHHA